MSNTAVLKAPFPWFGGKSRVADIVWERFGDVPNYVEPFFGSGAVLLGRPHDAGIETVNDLDGFLANFWRGVQSDPEAVAYYADWPVNENDLHARHVWLLEQRESLQARLDGDPDFHDPKIAGWWVWGLCCWIGSGWCSGNGPWQSVVVDGARQLVHVGNNGRGVNRKLVHVSNNGQGVNRQLVHVGNNGRGVNRKLVEWMKELGDRLRNVRVCSGDWSRVCGAATRSSRGQVCGVFLDPPYTSDCHDKCYTNNSLDVAHNARVWAVEHGGDSCLRIALCGYEGEHEMPDDWACVPWKARGGYGSQGKTRGAANAARERIWFSPHCLSVDREPELFEANA